MKKIKFTLKGGEFNKVGKIENIHEHLQEVKRVVGVKKSKKLILEKQSININYIKEVLI
jgi:hypothetical protein